MVCKPLSGNVLGLNHHEFKNRNNLQSITATCLKIFYTQGFYVYPYYEVVLETSVEKFKRILSYFNRVGTSIARYLYFNVVR